MTQHPRFGANPNLGEQVELRALDVDDIAPVRALVLRAFNKLCVSAVTESEVVAFAEQLGSAQFSSDLVAASEKKQATVGSLDGRIVSIVSIVSWSKSRENNITRRVRMLFVDPMFVRCGIGRQMLSAAERTFWNSGVSEVSVRSFVQASDFFQHAGYHVTSHGTLALPQNEALAVTFLRKELARVSPASD